MPAILLLGLAFVLTGASALVIEQSLERLLSTVVGASADASAIVLSVYFLGLSLGAVLYVRVRHRISNGARWYALLEGGVGLWAALLGLGFSQAQWLSCRVIQLAGEDALAVFAARLIVASVWVLPATLAMGGSFPSIVEWLTREAPGERRRLSTFYALNVAGGLLGSVLTAYLLFPHFGVRAVMLAVGAVQALLAFSVYRQFSNASTASDRPAASIGAVLRRPQLRGWLALGFFSGFVVFACEVLWVHLAGAVVGMSAYTFAAVISVVLFGLFIAGLMVSRVPVALDAALVPASLAMALLTGLIGAATWDSAPLWFLAFTHVDSFGAGELVRIGVLLVVVGVPSMGLGWVYPALLRQPIPGEDRDAATAALGLVNGLGGLCGALLTGFVAIGALGAEVTLQCLAAALTVVLVLTARSAVRVNAGALGVGLLALVAWLALPKWDRKTLTSGTNTYFKVGFVDRESELRFWHEDNTGGLITVVEKHGVETLLTNGKFQGNNAGEMVDQVGFAALPCLMTAGRGRALVIGLGTGQSAGVIHDFGFEQVDVVEIARGMALAADRFSAVNGNVLHQPNVTVHFEDGRNHLLRTPARFDVISMELTSIWFAGAASLYSEEFYRLAQSHLQPGGVMQQWVQLHHITLDDIAMVLRTMRAVFTHVSLWLLGSQGILIASETAPTLEVSRFDLESLRNERELLGPARIADLQASELLSTEALDRFLAAHPGPLNTDANRFLEYSTPRQNLSRAELLKDNVAALRAFSR